MWTGYPQSVSPQNRATTRGPAVKPIDEWSAPGMNCRLYGPARQEPEERLAAAAGGAGHHGVLGLQLAKLPGQGFNAHGHRLLLIQVILQELGRFVFAEILGQLYEPGVHRHLVM